MVCQHFIFSTVSELRIMQLTTIVLGSVLTVAANGHNVITAAAEVVALHITVAA